MDRVDYVGRKRRQQDERVGTAERSDSLSQRDQPNNCRSVSLLRCHRAHKQQS
jgi:hypothetical protein